MTSGANVKAEIHIYPDLCGGILVTGITNGATVYMPLQTEVTIECDEGSLLSFPPFSKPRPVKNRAHTEPINDIELAPCF
jgi:hypothetical protein